jgi:hypothetical protein
MTISAGAPVKLLWDELKTILRLVGQIWGDPAYLYEGRVLEKRDARRLRAWLAALEVIARALLAVMAMALPAPSRGNGRRRRREKPSTKRQYAPLSVDPLPEDQAHPEALCDSDRWAGVVFRVAPDLRRRGARGAPRAPMRFLSARSLAFRFEALIRVAESPQPYARRLARRLRVAAERRELAARLLRPPPRSGPPNGSPPWVELVEKALAEARRALAAPAPETG